MVEASGTAPESSPSLNRIKRLHSIYTEFLCVCQVFSLGSVSNIQEEYV